MFYETNKVDFFIAATRNHCSIFLSCFLFHVEKIEFAEAVLLISFPSWVDTHLAELS